MSSNHDNDNDNNEQIEETQTAIEQLNDYLKDLNDFKQTFNAFVKRGKDIKKALEKEMKQLKKKPKKRTRKPDAKPGGFQQPTCISEQLLKFLGVAKGTKLTRIQVSKKLNQWIKANNLQNPEDRRIIIPNEELKSLFNEEYDETDPDLRLDFFTMQKYIKHHFKKKEDKQDENTEILPSKSAKIKSKK